MTENSLMIFLIIAVVVCVIFFFLLIVGGVGIFIIMSKLLQYDTVINTIETNRLEAIHILLDVRKNILAQEFIDIREKKSLYESVQQSLFLLGHEEEPPPEVLPPVPTLDLKSLGKGIKINR